MILLWSISHSFSEIQQLQKASRSAGRGAKGIHPADGMGEDEESMSETYMCTNVL